MYFRNKLTLVIRCYYYILAYVDRRPSEIAYPTGLKIFLIVFALSLAVFCVALDNTIIATAIPRITDEFHALQNIGWYGSAYLLTTCAFQLFYGKLYSCFPIKMIFLMALSIFELGSVVCATSPSSLALITGRAIAGFGCAGVFTGGLIIVAHSAPVHKRPVYQGICGAIYGLASVVGPLIGGVFTDKLTWRWCFYINLPLGAVSALIVIFFLTLHSESPSNYKDLGFLDIIWRLDPIGTLLFVPSIICGLLALQWGGTSYAWDDGRIIGLFVLGALLLTAFVAVQLWLGENATVPSRILFQRTIGFGSVFGFLLGGSFFLLLYFLPVWFQAIKGVDALHSGIDSIPLVLSMSFGIMVSGGLVSKFGFYMPYVCASFVVTSIATGLLTTLTPSSSSAEWIGYQVLLGFGCGLAFQLPQIAAQAVLPLKDAAQGVSIIFFAQTLGGALFVSIGNTVLDNKLVQYIRMIHMPTVDPSVIVKLGAIELRSYVPAQYVEQVVEAYNHALADTFRISLILATLAAVGLAGMEWKSVHSHVEGEASDVSAT
ncbi:putative efflux pump antibiotic resistance protein [Mollisia scopiformis]|uniref:Putative efflux pump antibiotic resistance protein n=1 Tax=Mollisia scopiformis TaxID=149040 RepID=A0A132B8S8_MOLSC|nr:putative efflux pump antibiotic resistance protein [Mollisia scopiformis]KUJ08399.1 putative efflux pump antibiotic resistance protein [Mollisia scopiformis]